MTNSRDKEGQILDAAVDASNEELPSTAEAREILLEVGLVPGAVGRDLYQRLVRSSWRTEAQRKRLDFEQNVRARPLRPPTMTRPRMLAQLRQQPAQVGLRATAEMSDDDLWDLLCELKDDE